MRLVAVVMACAVFVLNLTAAYALPKRIIILRHAEKTSGDDLCQTGKDRATALREEYLGRNARKSLFAEGEQPSVFYAITGHTELTIDPSARSWGLDVNVPDNSFKKKYKDENDPKEAWENAWTMHAADDVLKNYDGKIVVMAWEHHRIADTNIDQKYTLIPRSGIDAFSVSRDWCGSNYDFFWVVEYDPSVNYNDAPPIPTKVTIVQQDFGNGYPPNNEWGRPEPAADQCEVTKKPECSAP